MPRQPRPGPPRRPPRRGSLDRPINARSVRGTLLLVALPLLLAAFTVGRPEALPPPDLPLLFDGESAATLAAELARDYPDRTPGSSNAAGAATWFSRQLALYGFQTTTDAWREDVPGLGDVELRNVSTVVAGRSPDTIVVMAHRDTAGGGPGTVDNASGTAALVELAKAYAAAEGVQARARPAHTIVFVSTDGGAHGSLGAARLARSPALRERAIAVLSLDALASARARLLIGGDEPRSPAATLVRTAAVRVLEETGSEPARPGALRQLLQLGFPVGFGEQAPFVAQGIPAVTLTGHGETHRATFGDAADLFASPAAVESLGELGRAAQALLGSLDAGLALTQGTASYLYLDDRVVQGWAVQLVLVCLLAPFLVGVVDLFARLRRRHVPLLPAVRSLRARLGFWAFVGLLIVLATLVGLLPSDPERPLAPGSDVADDWPVAGLAVVGALAAVGWFVARERLLPRRQASPEERLAGYTGALLGLGLLAITTLAVNPYALVYLIPALYAWLWLPQVASGPAWARALLLVLGLCGPLLGLAALAQRTGLGLDVVPYALRLFTSGYAQPATAVLLLAGAAVAGQLAALAAGRYAPYPDARERPPGGPLRQLLRSLLGRRRRLRPVDAATGGP
jgi:Peptidase family M28